MEQRLGMLREKLMDEKQKWGADRYVEVTAGSRFSLPSSEASEPRGEYSFASLSLAVHGLLLMWSPGLPLEQPSTAILRATSAVLALTQPSSLCSCAAFTVLVPTSTSKNNNNDKPGFGLQTSGFGLPPPLTWLAPFFGTCLSFPPHHLDLDPHPSFGSAGKRAITGGGVRGRTGARSAVTTRTCLPVTKSARQKAVAVVGETTAVVVKQAPPQPARHLHRVHPRRLVPQWPRGG